MNREIKIIILQARRLMLHPRYQDDVDKFHENYEKLRTQRIKSLKIIFETIHKDKAILFQVRYGISLPIKIGDIEGLLRRKQYPILKELFAMNSKWVQILDRPPKENTRQKLPWSASGLHSGLITLRIDPTGNKTKILNEIADVLKDHSKRNPPEKNISSLLKNPRF